jgi:hypothetical protein
MATATSRGLESGVNAPSGVLTTTRPDVECPAAGVPVAAKANTLGDDLRARRQ